MNDLPHPVTCDERTQQYTIHLPCHLAKRVGKYAKENANTITGVVIEALDTFMRDKKSDLPSL